ncbi:MAG: YmL10 [Bathelium mastoideum]|nr:MAG: YmL10 [Bathelium mastoideum]
MLTSLVNSFAAKLSPLNLDRVQAWINEGRLDTSKPITLKELSESRCLHGIKADGVKLLARDAEKLTHPINIVVSRASAAAIAAVERVGGQVVTRYYTQQSIRRILRGESHPTGPLESFPIDPPLSSVPALPTSSFPAITTPSWSISATIKSPISASAVAAPNGTGGASGLEKGRYEYALGYHYRLPNPAARKAIEYYRDPAHRGYLAHTLDNGQGPSLFFRSDAERAAEKERKMKGRGEGGKAGRKREVDNRLF